MTPSLSVIVPVHNASSTIAAAVGSVLAQTDADFELILIDDGSTDTSLAELLALASSDPRLRVIAQPNAGVAATRNLGAELAAAPLLAFLDADDLWAPEKLAMHRDLHRRDPSLGVSFAQIAFIAPAATGLAGARTHSTVPAGDLTLAQLLGENPVCTASNLVVTRACFDAVGGFRAGMGFAEDQEWLARAAARGARIAGIDALLTGYRMSAGGLSAELDRMYDGWRALVAPYRATLDLAASEAVYCRYLARRALRTGAAPALARHFALRGISLDWRSFLADHRRGGLTLAGVAMATLLPAPLRTRLFA